MSELPETITADIPLLELVKSELLYANTFTALDGLGCVNLSDIFTIKQFKQTRFDAPYYESGISQFGTKKVFNLVKIFEVYGLNITMTKEEAKNAIEIYFKKNYSNLDKYKMENTQHPSSYEDSTMNLQTESLSFIGKAIEYFMTQSSLKRGAFCKTADIRESYLSYIISGKRIPTIETLNKISYALKMPIELIFLKAKMMLREENALKTVRETDQKLKLMTETYLQIENILHPNKQ